MAFFSRWFGGVYKDSRNFFPQFAVDPVSYFIIYPEYILTEEARDRFYRDRRSAIVGRRLAQEHGFEVGDMVTLKGQIFPGHIYPGQIYCIRARSTRATSTRPNLSG